MLAKLEVEKEKKEAEAAKRKEEIAQTTQEIMAGLPTEFGMKKDDKLVHKKRNRSALEGQNGNGVDVNLYRQMNLPVTCEIVLAHGTKTISAMALDPKGGRLLTGSYDYIIKMWDFAGMTSTLQSFREMEPEEGHLIKQIRYNRKGGKFLCITGYRCASIFTRDGVREYKTNRGDMYIHDLQHTVGHVASLTDGHWNPKDETEILTASEDGTMRIWDISVERRSKEYIKLKSRTARRTPVTSCAFSPNGSMIAGAGRLGSLQIWERKAGRTGPRAKKRVMNAHEPQTETSCVTFASDSRTLISRGGDGTLKVWDVRKFKKPLKVFKGLPNLYPTSDAVFSPKGDYIITGTSNREEKTGKGELVIFSRKDLKEMQRIRISQSSVVRVMWNRRLNQIMCGCADGATRVLYDPNMSKNGALLCIKKKAKKKSAMDFGVFQHIQNPHALPLFAETQNPKRLRVKARADPIQSKKPLEPMKGEGVGGRIGVHNLTTHLLQAIAKTNVRQEDPREALLAYDEKTKNDPMFFGNAYKHTQPKQIYAEGTEEEEENEEVKKLKEKISSAPLGADPESYRKEW
eukprot:CAMPEP_0167749212 /NCGR_PEP_ID=MMETSP0110_2-20121227/5274_1 /TAXON_ID=629695 /ORGANISM="Gymnochlora sp., Strain CCMP2014" /LENGTH=573 /DNA_ID=CAMNT_0007634325 /DNA_START=75 /DNA_END=1793 /DNA_ORIENTATION=-